MTDTTDTATPTASTSSWLWSQEHALYYNQTTQQWAKPQEDGSWAYSDAQDATAKSTGEKTTEGDQERAVAAEDGAGAEEDIDGVPVSIPLEHQTWPSSRSPSPVEAPIPLLRLLVLRSSVLTPSLIALADSSCPLLIGRDKSFEKLIRLKEMEVSKSHATIWFDRNGQDEGWKVVDNGSTHGTYLWDEGGKGKKVRLSEPKVASQPYSLSHISTLSVGSTTFLVHLHRRLPCTECSINSTESNLVPLQSTSSSSATATPTPINNYSVKTKAEKEVERRERLKGLKESYSLAGKAKEKEKEIKPFVDRAAARRSRTIATAIPIPSVPPPPPPSAPSDNPFSETSKGYQLLSKLGGSSSTEGLGKVVDAKIVGNMGARAGLGSQVAVVAGEEGKRGWREEGLERSRKRYKEMSG